MKKYLDNLYSFTHGGLSRSQYFEKAPNIVKELTQKLRVIEESGANKTAEGLKKYEAIQERLDMAKAEVNKVFFIQNSKV